MRASPADNAMFIHAHPVIAAWEEQVAAAFRKSTLDRRFRAGTRAHQTRVVEVAALKMLGTRHFAGHIMGCEDRKE